MRKIALYGLLVLFALAVLGALVPPPKNQATRQQPTPLPTLTAQEYCERFLVFTVCEQVTGYIRWVDAGFDDCSRKSDKSACYNANYQHLVTIGLEGK
jgi:hypothetical protein